MIKPKPYILCTFDNMFGIVEFDIVTSTPPLECLHCLFVCNLQFIVEFDIVTSTPPLECLHCLFVCNFQFKQIAFLYIQILHN